MNLSVSAKKPIIILITTLSIVFGLLFGLAYQANALVDDCSATFPAEVTKCEACNGTGGTYSGDGCGDGSGTVTQDTVSDLVKDVINIFSFIVGVASVLMIMIGGFKYVTSQGDSNNITSAKNTILYAIIGLVVVAFAQVIVQFVIGKI